MSNHQFILSAENLRLNYKGKPVLNNLSVSFTPGEPVLIAGKSGAGKSTLLKCLAGVRLPDSGAITRAPGLSARNIGLLSDSMSLFEDLSLRQGIAFHCRAFQIPAFNDSLIRLLGLDLSRSIRDLSVGERVLFHLSLLISQKPELLMMDEVIHTIDPYLRDIALDALIDLIDQFNTTIITVNQTFSEVEHLPERILVLDQGKIHMDIRREDLLAGMRRVIAADDVPAAFPVIFKKNIGIYKEIYIFPFREEMASSGFQFMEPRLPDALKAVIGGLYVQKRV